MVASIDQRFINQFNANVMHLSQQQVSYLAPFVRTESHKGEMAFYDRLGSIELEEKTERHGDTKLGSIEHSRRAVNISDFEKALPIDDEDVLKTFDSPQNKYAEALSMAVARKKDDVIIDAALGTARYGKRGENSISFPDSQKVVAFDGSTTDGVDLNVQTVKKAKRKFDDAEVVKGMARYLCHSPSGLESMLNQTEVTSSDYNSVKALVQGDIDTYLGFKWIMSNRLNVYTSNTTYQKDNGAYGSEGNQDSTIVATDKTIRRNFAWAGDGLLLSVARDSYTSVSRRADKSDMLQVLFKLNIGAVRMEEVKVVEIVTAEV